ncbi:Hypothetical predicted protein [Mytilus galloprovincialis]|uniref:Uncharacterized protein n=1 Tax=Mytilus galloprovincialis TaxID=29158 RepID=A0A8B6FPX0_MYTGA|nr:Hypothetical predicted protein [Mytilus galloprovincialis]
MYPHLPLPELGLIPVYKANKISEFDLENDILDIVPASSDNAWLLTETSMCMLSYKGISEKSGHNLDTLPNSTRIVRKTANELWLWYGGSIFRNERSINKKVGYEVPFKNALFCCAVTNGNLFVYNEWETKFYELSDNDGVQNKFEIEDFPKKIIRRKKHTFLPYNNRVKHVAMTQSKNLNFVISTGDNCVLFTDKNFKVLNTFWKSGAEVNAIAMDIYANVFLADSKNGNIYICYKKMAVFGKICLARMKVFVILPT